jgi:pimeloyl-ACP methyl ester carboxylesterase
MLPVLLLALSAALPPATRADHRVTSAPGIEIAVREVRPASRIDSARPPVLLVHGARVPGVASFDLPVEGGSLAADLAAAGFRVYVMDARGYGRSTRPARMEQPPEGGAPIARSSEVVEDIGAVVQWIVKRTGAPRVALVGWATGGHWSGYYASRYPRHVARLVLYNTMYGGGSNHPAFGRGSELEDPKRRGTFNRQAFGAYRLADASSLLRNWDTSIPAPDKSAWRDPNVAAAYVREALASDPTSASRTPPSLRAPSGAMADTFEVASGSQPWDAGLVQAPTLIIAAELDFWSRREDRERLAAHLVNAGAVKQVVIPQATHFVHLDRPQRGRDLLLRELIDFLRGETTPAPSK